MISLRRIVARLRAPQQITCLNPECDIDAFFSVKISMERYRHHMPRITSINDVLVCENCGAHQSYQNHVRVQRGWDTPVVWWPDDRGD